MHDHDESDGQGDSSKADHCCPNGSDCTSDREPMDKLIEPQAADFANPERYLPSPADIAEATEAIRSGWDDAEYLRRQTSGAVRWRIPGEQHSEVFNEKD